MLLFFDAVQLLSLGLQGLVHSLVHLALLEYFLELADDQSLLLYRLLHEVHLRDLGLEF